MQNAFPVSGQLYTTHLLSLEALVTVIDSIEAHCQAKVINRAAEQEHSETLTAEGEASVDSTADAVTGLTMISVLIFSSHKYLLSCCSAFANPLSFFLFFLVHTEAGKSLFGANGQTTVESGTQSVCPPTSGHLMAEKMKLGRQDQDESDLGTRLTVHLLNNSYISLLVWQ